MDIEKERRAVSLTSHNIAGTRRRTSSRQGRMGVDPAARSLLDSVAKNLVITWASSARQDGETSRTARDCFEGAVAISLSVCAGPELLIAVDDFQQQWTKSFQHLDTSLAGQAACSRTFCAEERLDRPSALQDVESAHQRSGCRLLAAMPIIGDGIDVLGVVCVGLPAHVQPTPKHMQTLGALAEALVPYLQHYSKDHNLLWDTSVFVANSIAQCLPGCSCTTCASSDQGSAGEEEWMDFDFSAYADVMEDNLTGYVADWDAPPRWTDLEEGTNGSTSLDSTCSESMETAEALRSNLKAGAAPGL